MAFEPGVYDEATAAAIERRGEPRRPVPPVSVRGWRRGVGGAAILTAATLGAADVLEPDREEAIVEEVDVDLLERDLAVVVRLVPGAPRLSRAWVRPWLLAADRP